MTGKTRPCPHCGVSLPDDAAFCPFCAEHIRPRQTVKVPSHLWRKGLGYAAVLVALALLAAAIYSYVTPNVYDAWGELTYPLDGND